MPANRYGAILVRALWFVIIVVIVLMRGCAWPLETEVPFHFLHSEMAQIVMVKPVVRLKTGYRHCKVPDFASRQLHMLTNMAVLGPLVPECDVHATHV